MSQESKNESMFSLKLIPAWLTVFALFCISFLPMKQKQSFGKPLGRFASKMLKKRVVVAKRNISLCFPELSSDEQSKLVEDTMTSCARGFLECTHVWWQDVTPYVDNVIITGREHLEEAKKRKKGILLMGGHFSIFDLVLPLLSAQHEKPGYMYRPNKNPVIDRMMQKGRQRHYNVKSFDRRSIKQMIEFIKSGGAAWYAVDQDFNHKCDIFAPFFGIDAGCITTPSWVAKESNATVLQASQFRHPNGQYEIVFSPIFENFGECPKKDAEDWNNCLEQAIRQHPEQYFWLHRRFKTRPKGEPSLY